MDPGPARALKRAAPFVDVLVPPPPSGAPLHLAVIPDGNGRWARARGTPRIAGHRAGADAVRRLIEAAPGCGVGTLTIYAFSADNWGRPPAEVDALFSIFEGLLREETPRALAEGVSVRVIGRRDRLPETLLAAIEAAEAETAAGGRLRLRFALDYSARDSIRRAALLFAGSGDLSRESFARTLGAVDHDPEPTPAVDLVLRTGGEQRLSDFLLWENAYAELLFSPVLWPDFAAPDLEAAIREFRSRDRRFGRLPAERAAGARA